jgi:multidrug efflux pump subunit AcrB
VSEHKKGGFNLSEIALNNQQFMFFIILILAIGGIFAYFSLGRAENPTFTIRTMTVSAKWPGASAQMVADQVTEKIENKLQQTPGLRYLNSNSRAGEAVIYVNINDPYPSKDLPVLWKKVRNMVSDIAQTLPQGVEGPYFNDDFGDVYGNMFALTTNGEYSLSDLNDIASNRLRTMMVQIPDVSKVQVIGAPNNMIYVDLNNQKLATLGIDPTSIYDQLKQQNAVLAGGMDYTNGQNIFLRVNGIFQNLDQIRNIGIIVNAKTFKLGDIATITGGYDDPPQNEYYYNGNRCVAIAVSMVDGGNILNLGSNLAKMREEINSKTLPRGVKLEKITDQGEIVAESIGDFTTTLALAIIIILVISFISLGGRAGIVTALSIPLVLFATFMFMKALGQGLNSITLGALIISLGLLVDDAIIAMEMMEKKLSEGWTKFDAASAAFKVTALSMFTGTMVTVAGFMPVGFSAGQASEFCFGMFVVVGVSLTVSWFSSVTIIPTLGYHIMKESVGHAKEESKMMKTFNTKFRAALVWALHHRLKVIIVTFLVFAVAAYSMRFVPKEFFPASNRGEVIIDVQLPLGSSIYASETASKKLMKIIEDLKKSDNPLGKKVVNYSVYVGQCAPRFVLTFNTTDDDTNFSEMVLLMADEPAREEMMKMVNEKIAPQMPEAIVHPWVISNGPPSQYPVQFRVYGYDPDTVQEYSLKLKEIMLKHPGVDKSSINNDWYEKSKILNLTIDQIRARQLGVTTEYLSYNLQSSLSGVPATQFYKQDQDAIVTIRQKDAKLNINDIDRIKNIQVFTTNNTYIPLSQIADLSYGAEYGLIARRNLVPTVTVSTNVNTGFTGNDVELQIYEQAADLIKSMPSGYGIDCGSDLENSQRSAAFLTAVYPMMILVILFLLMCQLQHMGKTALVILTAPLGIIGVVAAMLPLQAPMGFVANLGIIALAGMIIRNSVILIHQIGEGIIEGAHPYDSIIDAAIMRFRPILLTATAAIAGFIPLMSDIFWGPMAVAIAGGLIVATALTLIFLPALYAFAFRIQPPQKQE